MHFGVLHNRVRRGGQRVFFLVFGPGGPRPSEPGTRIERGLRSGGTSLEESGYVRSILMRVDQPCLCGS